MIRGISGQMRALSLDTPLPRRSSDQLLPNFTMVTFEHNNRSYYVEAVKESSTEVGRSIWHWQIMVNGVVEHTLRTIPHENRASLMARAIRTIDETSAGAIRELDFEYEGKRYRLEDRSDKLRSDGAGDTGMWCVTCDGVMEGSFQAKLGESQAVLRARAIQIARRSGEYQARLRSSSRPQRARPLRQIARARTSIKSTDTLPVPPSSPTPVSRADAADIKGSEIPQLQRAVTASPATPTPAPTSTTTIHAEKTPRRTQPRMVAPTPKTASPVVQPVKNGQDDPAPRKAPPQPRPTTGRIAGTVVAVAKPEPGRLNNVGHRISRVSRGGGQSATNMLQVVIGILLALVLVPLSAVRKRDRPRARSLIVRRVEGWLEAVPLRMILPYAGGAALVLGLIPMSPIAWAALAMAAIVWLPLRARAGHARFALAEHVYDRTRTSSQRIGVHTNQKGGRATRRVGPRRRPSTQRVLRSVAR